jgi:hypothetical protein
MRSAQSRPALAVATVALASGAVLVGVGGVGRAAAEPVITTASGGARTSTGSVVIPLVGDRGRPVFCGGNHTGGRARPQAEGGYEVIGLAPGRHVVHLELTDERIDVLVMVVAGEDVVVPPVVVGGPCRDLSLRAPLIDLVPDASLPAWTLRIGRRYAARSGIAPAVFERDRGLIPMGAAQTSTRDRLLPSTRRR